MNHDYCHCLDYTSDCPEECFRAQLEKDIKKNPLLIGKPLTYGHLGGTSLCGYGMPKRREKNE